MIALCVLLFVGSFPICNPDLDWKTRAIDLVSRMNVDGQTQRQPEPARQTEPQQQRRSDFERRRVESTRDGKSLG